MPQVFSFPPLVPSNARVLILGSMPGIASLKARQYYAHPQNQFWPILGALLNFDPANDYARRVAMLLNAGIAVWDILQSCHREGSLDAAIDITSAVPNDFNALLTQQPSIRRICFNGAAAESLFLRQVKPHLIVSDYDYVRLPSTSPANASLSKVEKLQRWREALESTDQTMVAAKSAK